MTREEAIQVLEEEAEYLYQDDRPYNREAFDMAVEALSAELPKGDYISREDAMGAVQDHFNADGFKGYDDGQQMMDRINALPSAEAQGCDGCRYNTRIPKEQCLRCCRYWRDGYEHKGGQG